MSSGKLTLGLLAVLVLFGGIYFYTSQGYGQVSPDAYEASKALYGACLSKRPERLDAVEQIMSENAEPPLELSATERNWLNSMIEQARSGDWKGAAESARRMMEDQVEY